MKPSLTLAEGALGRRYPQVIRLLPPGASLDDACIEVEVRTGASFSSVRDAALETLRGHLRKETNGIKSIGRLCYRDTKAALWCLANVARENFRLISPDESCRRGLLTIERYVGGFVDHRDVKRALDNVTQSMENMDYGGPEYFQCYAVQQMLSVASQISNGGDYGIGCIELQHSARSFALARGKKKARLYIEAIRIAETEKTKIAREVADGILTLPLYDRIRA